MKTKYLKYLQQFLMLILNDYSMEGSSLCVCVCVFVCVCVCVTVQFKNKSDVVFRNPSNNKF